NAAIWTGRDEGREVLKGDILLDQGLVKWIGHADKHLLDEYQDLNRVDARGRWVTPG
ncbi:hypothetical protein TRAPUB_1488, partial [Trametes pubescens]